MRPRMVLVRAKSPQEAAEKAAPKLGTEPDNISVKEVDSDGKGKRYEASVVNCDAALQLEISDDAMIATVVHGVPAYGSGRPFDGPRLLEFLRNQGIMVSPDTAVAKKMLKMLASGKEVRNVVIARGTSPQPAADAKVEPLGDWDYPVFPNDAIGRLVPATVAQPGKNVYGNHVNPTGPERGKSINLVEGGGCFIDQSSLNVRSDRFGIVTKVNQDIFINDSQMLEISKDHMEVRATIYPKDFRGNRITMERMRSALEAEGLSGTVDQKALVEAIEQASESGAKVKDVVICRGHPPTNGTDGWFEMIYKDDRPDFGEIDEDTGRMDFRARGVVRTVEAGELLGRLHPPKQGVPGRDVYSRVIPTREGVAFNLQLTGNVEAGENEDEYYASGTGMVFFVGNTLSVTDVFTIEGDVNMRTGNIVLEDGSVHVRGAVLSGFSVTSPGNVLVEDLIENSQVKAEGDIEVLGGIVMDPKGGKVSAKGGLSALYAKNATIVVGGDLNITHELSNCIVFAGNKVNVVKGRGRIIGSTVRAGKGVVANEIGSDLGVETTIFLGIERRSFSEELAQKKKLQSVLQRIYGSLGTDDPKSILARAPKEKRQAVASLLQARLRAEKKIKAIEQELEKERQRVRKAVEARVRVRKVIYPGTIINCFGVSLKISEPVHNSQVYYDPKEQKVVVASM